MYSTTIVIYIYIYMYVLYTQKSIQNIPKMGSERYDRESSLADNKLDLPLPCQTLPGTTNFALRFSNEDVSVLEGRGSQKVLSEVK